MPRLLALMLAAASSAAGAQNFAIPTVTADSSVLLGCLASGKTVQTCLGGMTLDCMAENDIGNENLEERLCVDEELNVWRDLLRQAEGRLQLRFMRMGDGQRPALSGDPATLLPETGARWRDWVEAQCRLERAAEGHGDRRGIVEDACMRDLTAARYGRLQRLAGE